MSSSSAGSGTEPRRGRRVDPRTLALGSIAGVVHDERGAPVVDARVCVDLESAVLTAELTRDPICVAADAHGTFTIAKLLAARYRVLAMAPRYVPAAYPSDGFLQRFELAAGEHKVGVAIVLESGGSEVTGSVTDVTGGPIAGARVWGAVADLRPYIVESDERGRFRLWSRPGHVTVQAVAEGYTEAHEVVEAPGTLDLQLVPESSISGTVVDATTGEPRAGVRVAATADALRINWSNSGALTDDAGKFRIDRLQPSRYELEAKAPDGFGRAEGSTLVGLGQHAGGVVVKLHPAYEVEAKVMIAGTQQACEHAQFTIGLSATSTSGVSQVIDGRNVIDGVLPGTYRAHATCKDHLVPELPPIVVVDHDVTDLVWQAAPTGSVHGHVRTAAGTPVRDAIVLARTGFNSATTDRQGEYTFTLGRPGRYPLEVWSTAGASPEELAIELTTATSKVEQDIVLGPASDASGVVVDARGRAVPQLWVRFRHLGPISPPHHTMTKPDGKFHLDGLAPGNYEVQVSHREYGDPLRKPGASDDSEPGEQIEVELGKTANARIVVEQAIGKITGTVVDPAGKPIADAWVVGVRERGFGSTASTFWESDAPIVTALDGTFELRKLEPGTYTVRAFRRGGGDAIAEHVALGAKPTLQVKETASFEGVISLPSGAPSELTLHMRSAPYRHEQLFRTGGHYVLRDLPAGTYELDVTAPGGRSRFKVTVAAGEHRTGEDHVLEPLVTLTGKLVERGTRKPVAGLELSAQPAGGAQLYYDTLDDRDTTTASGTFRILAAPVGPIIVIAYDRTVRIERTIPLTATGTVDLGEVEVDMLE